MSATPLAGLKVLEFTHTVMGPTAGLLFADLGADVVKVEPAPRGDHTRGLGGFAAGFFAAFNRNKRSLALDLKREGGLEVLRRLVARADVFVQSLRAGAIAELGLDYPSATNLNPRLVYCSITAYGTRGPMAHLPGYDPLMQAYAGLMSVNGHPGQEPARVGTSIVDMGTGMWAALGIMAGLRQRESTGRGVEVTTALFDTTLMWVSYHAMGYLGSGDVPQPQGSGTQMIAPYQAFPTADGYAMIGAASDALFKRLAGALDAPDLLGDARFIDNPSRVRHRAEVVEAVSTRTRAFKTSDLIERLRAAGVPGAPILTLDQVLQEPQTQASGMLVGAPHPRLPDYRSLGLPIQWDGRRPGVRRVPPQLGEHSADVLTWLGYTLDDVRTLKTQGLVQ
jgi:crotonobetainyl-CoA:carnitine CoA-transferase CaiB-like acyl-CoA transferase